MKELRVMFNSLFKGATSKRKAPNTIKITKRYICYYSLLSASTTKTLTTSTINEGQPPKDLYSIKRALLH